MRQGRVSCVVENTDSSPAGREARGSGRSRFGLQARALLAPLVLIVLMTAAFATVFLSFEQQSSALTESFKTSQARNSIVTNAYSRMVNAHSEIYRMMSLLSLGVDSGQLRQVGKIQSDQIAGTRASLKRLIRDFALTDEERQQTGRVISALRSYDLSAQEAIGAATAGLPMASLFMVGVEQDFHSLRAAFDRLDELASVVQYDVVLVDTATAQLPVIGMLALAALLGIAITVFTTRRIIRPIVGVTDAMRRLATGDTDVETGSLDRGDEIGDIARALEVFKDNAIERKQAETALRESEERYAFAISGTAEGLWDWNSQTRELYLSPRWKEILGYQDDEFENSLQAYAAALHEEDHDRVMEATRAHLQERVPFDLDFRLRCKGENYVWIHARGRAVWNDRGDPLRMAGSISDITERKKAEEDLSYQATHDALTGLINRGEFERRVERVLDTARAAQDEHALCYLDLDQFKVINDTCGHMAGDAVLRQLGELLSTRVRKRDTLARLGGDEFRVLMEHCTLEQARRVANSVRSTVAEYHFVWEKRVFRIGAK